MKKVLLFLVLSLGLYQWVYANFDICKSVDDTTFSILQQSENCAWLVKIWEIAGNNDYISFGTVEFNNSFTNNAFFEEPFWGMQDLRLKINNNQTDTYLDLVLISSEQIGAAIMFTYPVVYQIYNAPAPTINTNSWMQGAIDAFWSGAVAGAIATSSGSLGIIVYVLLGVTIFFIVGGIIMYAIHRFDWKKQ